MRQRIITLSAVALLLAVEIVCLFPTRSFAQTTEQPAVVKAVAPVFHRTESPNPIGSVVVEVQVNASGIVTAAHAIQGHPLLYKTSENAAKRWQFAPDSESDVRKVRLTFMFKIMDQGTPEEDLSPIYIPPYQLEVRRTEPVLIQRQTVVPTESAERNKPDQEIAVDAFQVAGAPLGISNATLTNTKQGYELQFSGSNNSNEQLLGLRYILLFIDSAGALRSAFEQSENLKLTAYSSGVIRFSAPLGFTIDREDRAFLIAVQVVGHESIWEIWKGKEALQHYAKGDGFAMPDVRRFPNLVDAPASGLRIIP